MFTTMKIATR